MSIPSAPRPNRSRRGQVMIVGNGIEPPAGFRWPRAPRHVDNLFDALGELTVSTPSDAIATVAITSEHLHNTEGDPQLAIQAVRRVDPSVRIVLLESARFPSHAIGFEGFDDTLHCPLRSDDIARLFDEDAPPEPTPEPSPEPPAPEPAAASSSDANAARSAANNDATEDSPVHSPPAPPPPAPATLHSRANEHSASSANAPHLGDTDLVEAILSSPDGVQAIALQLMAQQTGWSDIQLTAAADAGARSLSHAAPSPVSVEVSHAGQTFGRLSTARATAAQLEPWALWLGHWLALDHSYREHRLHAFQDCLTGAWNRRFFDTFLRDAIARAHKVRRPVTVMVFDLDNFKSYNDDFGHKAGDDILCETVRLMNSVIRHGDRVCRIGGDEFAVIFADPEGPRQPGSTHPDSVEIIAKRFQDKVCSMSFPKLGMEAPGTLSISAGLATYPWDGSDPEALLRHADQLALESKRKGKNAITFGPGAQRVCGKKE
jgi:two-component system cell cycle response regulator